ncbi:MAG: 1-(5-phosphoribosyl)-5-[(5-phosphoribosylamino)methylideneamino]imidazole-4-carboxamide isomerase [Chloroflexota bacterium]|nr:MAG: 1-(5-phosphoribosyl)-5-[(5-phosphoribosylamino)methylideneamino]imidazole-4-carboxamide isomerase [Chloroflexota bacterium]
MDVIPAIDIRGGRAVRLFQGDYSRETIFADDPIAVARRWAAAGAGLIHVVDLDGARGEGGGNRELIAHIARVMPIPIQVGGGIKSLDAAAAMLGAGVRRIVFGSLAARDPTVIGVAVERWGDQVVVGIDARDGRVAVDGWTQTVDRNAFDLARDLAALGVGRFIFTDIARDGTMSEPNFDAMAAMAAHTFARVIASGGVATVAHVARLRDTGVEGVIVGRALYDGSVDLSEAIEAGRGAPRPTC